MTGENLREAILRLSEEGKGKKEIARFLKRNVKTVRKIIKRNGIEPKTRSDKKTIDEDLLRKVYGRCDGYVQRMHEILMQEYNTDIAYSTLTRLVREHGLGCTDDKRSMKFPDIPGAEMQHDTSEYTVLIGTEKRRVIASGLYFRYNKMRFVVFYYRFNRFRMKCFLHRALTWFGYTASVCIIDNTHLAVLHGTGENAVFNEEMVTFAKSYGFTWKAHRIMHSNRKAGKERNFHTLETNFFPGRTFKSLEDLNDQAFKWATEYFAERPQSKSRLIPRELFDMEKSYLIKLPDYIEPPYQYHERKIDTYGYVAFNGNYYWIPEGKKGYAKIVEYENSISIYQKHTKLIDYDLPPWGTKNERITPPGMKSVPYQPVNRQKGCVEEEKKLIAMGSICASYIEYIKSKECTIPHKPKFIRQLYRFSKSLSASLFLDCIKRAHKYSIARIESLELIARDLLIGTDKHPSNHLPYNSYEDRPEYQKGRFSYDADPAWYSNLLKEYDNE